MAQEKKSGSTGFDVLERLWVKDLVPKDLERHYCLYWFALHSGDVDQIAGTLGVHRNSVTFHFDRLGLSERSDALRRFWLLLADSAEKNPFESDFFRLLQIDDAPSIFNPQENLKLIGLWKSRFPFKTIGAHYILWAIRNGKSKVWIQKRVGFSAHHCMRLLVSALDPRTESGHWLAPLKPMPAEIYARGPKKNDRLKLKISR